MNYLKIKNIQCDKLLPICSKFLSEITVDITVIVRSTIWVAVKYFFLSHVCFFTGFQSIANTIFPLDISLYLGINSSHYCSVNTVLLRVSVKIALTLLFDLKSFFFAGAFGKVVSFEMLAYLITAELMHSCVSSLMHRLYFVRPACNIRWRSTDICKCFDKFYSTSVKIWLTFRFPGVHAAVLTFSLYVILVTVLQFILKLEQHFLYNYQYLQDLRFAS